MTLLDRHLEADRLSAALDGDADPGARAHLEACSACRERLESWRAVVASLRSTAGADRLPAGDADRVVATALASAPPPTAGGVAAPGPRARARRSASTPWRKVLVTAAAGIAAAGVVALAVAGLAHLGSGPSAASSAGSAGAPPAPASGGHKSASAAAGLGSSSSGSSSAPKRSALKRSAALPAELGPVAGGRDLERELRSTLGSGPGAGAVSAASGLTTSGSTGSSTRSGVLAACLPAASRRSGRAAGRPVLVAPVRFAGKPDEVYVYADGHSWEAWVLSRGCAPITELHF